MLLKKKKISGKIECFIQVKSDGICMLFIFHDNYMKVKVEEKICLEKTIIILNAVIYNI